MYIVQIIDGLSLGGAQKLLITFAQEARARGLRLAVISLSANNDSPFLEQLVALGVTVHFFPTRRLINLKVLWQIVRWLQCEKPDVLHAHLTYSNVIGALAGRLAGIPVVTTLHTNGIEPQSRNSKTVQAEKLALRYGVDRIIACGPAVAESFRPSLGNKAMQVIPNATTKPLPALPLAERLALRAQITGDSARPLIISAGRLIPPKAFHDLLSAFATIVHRTDLKAFLAIAGSGELHDQLAKQIADLNLTDHAKLLGMREDMSGLLAASDIFVLSSHWEALPLVVLEAMGAGLPVVATNVGDIAWAVGMAGVIVPPRQPEVLADAIGALLREPERWQALGRAGQARIEDRFSAASWFEEIYAVYLQLCPTPFVRLAKDGGL